MNTLIDKVRDNGLCLGCGICAGISKPDSVTMTLKSNGFIEPEVHNLSSADERLLKNICPGIYLNHESPDGNGHPVWGEIKGLYSACSTDSVVHYEGSSGGIVSQIAISLLESSQVSAILQIGGDSKDYTRNSLKISRTKDDVISCASSRYAPASVFDNILQLLENTNDKFAFIGKPCDVSTLVSFLTAFPQYTNRFAVKIAILCAGLPSFNGTKQIVDEFQPAYPIKDLQYRGKGWPGYFSFTDSKNVEYRKSYNDSWGSSLNRYLNFRCKVCPDGIGLQADIAVGDAWETESGYPDFSEKEGKSLVIVRTTNGEEIYRHMYVNNDIESEKIGIEKIKLMQPYQYHRRSMVGARLLAFRIRKGSMIRFKGFRINLNVIKNRPKDLIREFVGTYKRVGKI